MVWCGRGGGSWIAECCATQHAYHKCECEQGKAPCQVRLAYEEAMEPCLVLSPGQCSHPLYLQPGYITPLLIVKSDFVFSLCETRSHYTAQHIGVNL